MHLLEVLSLSCCLAAGAVLLGPRQPAAAAAYESGHGYYEEEPDAGEPKVSLCTRDRCPRGMCLRVRLNGRRGEPTDEYLGEAFLRRGLFRSEGKIYLRRKNTILSRFSGLLEGKLRGEQLHSQRNAKHLMGRGSP